MILVTLCLLLKSDLDVQETSLSLLNKNLTLNSSFRCCQIDNCQDMILVTHCLLLKSDLDAQQTHLSLLNKNLTLNSSFRCCQIDKCQDMILVTLCCATQVRLSCLKNHHRIRIFFAASPKSAEASNCGIMEQRTLKM
jgi:hypothetical protein